MEIYEMVTIRIEVLTKLYIFLVEAKDSEKAKKVWDVIFELLTK